MTTEKPYTRVHVRWMIRRDLEEVLGIETRSFEFAWTEEDFLRCLRKRNVIGMVAEYGDRIVGYMLYRLSKCEVTVVNFAVDPRYRRTGVGAQLATKLLGKLSSHRRRGAVLMVRESNLTAQLFFRACGFRAAGVTRGYYEDTGETAYRMEHRLPLACPDCDHPVPDDAVPGAFCGRCGCEFDEEFLGVAGD